MQNPPPCAFTKKTPESEIIKSETYKIQSDNKKEYNILCENREMMKWKVLEKKMQKELVTLKLKHNLLLCLVMVL